MTALGRQNPPFVCLFISDRKCPVAVVHEPAATIAMFARNAAYILGGHPEKLTARVFTGHPKPIRTMYVLSYASCMLVLLAVTTGEEVIAPIGPPMTSLPQCRCDAIDACTKETQVKTDACKLEPTCEKFLKEIGDSAKIRACLDSEHAEMLKMEQCVKDKVGELGCTNEIKPKNLTVPVMPFGVLPPPPPPPPPMPTNASMDQNEKEVPPAGPSSPGPPQLAQYLLCVDQCALVPKDPQRVRRSPLNCSMKMKCALAPPTEAVQDAFRTCEEELKVDARLRFVTSCECMKAAGVTGIDCSPPLYY